MSRESPRFLTHWGAEGLRGERGHIRGEAEALFRVPRNEITWLRGRLPIGTAKQAGGRKHFGAYRAPLRCRRTSPRSSLRYEGLSARGLHFLDRIDNDIRGVPIDALFAYRSIADTIAIPIGQSCRGCRETNATHIDTLQQVSYGDGAMQRMWR